MRKKNKNKSEEGRIKRHYKIRKTLSGTKERPRLVVHRSNKNLYAQLVDDFSSMTLLSISTNDKIFKKESVSGSNIEAAKKFGSYIAVEAKKKGIEKVVFDRGGYLYHGRIKELADSARESGLKF
jgi:large subunit ribosomal protein L18